MPAHKCYKVWYVLIERRWAHTHTHRERESAERGRNLLRVGPKVSLAPLGCLCSLTVGTPALNASKCVCLGPASAFPSASLQQANKANENDESIILRKKRRTECSGGVHLLMQFVWLKSQTSVRCVAPWERSLQNVGVRYLRLGGRWDTVDDITVPTHAAQIGIQHRSSLCLHSDLPKQPTQMILLPCAKKDCVHTELNIITWWILCLGPIQCGCSNLTRYFWQILQFCGHLGCCQVSPLCFLAKLHKGRHENSIPRILEVNLIPNLGGAFIASSRSGKDVAILGGGRGIVHMRL